MPDDLVKRLLHYSALPASRASSARELCAEAAAALEAKDVEIAEARTALAVERDVVGMFAAEIAALKARLAAAEAVIDGSRALRTAWLERSQLARHSAGIAAADEFDVALTAYDALRAAQDRMWFRRLPVAVRLIFRRLRRRREFLPMRPIRGVWRL